MGGGGKGGKKGGKQTVFRYGVDMHLMLSQGPLNTIRRIIWGEKESWRGNVTSSQPIEIDAPDLFGGDQREGGIIGTANVMMGEPGQTWPADMENPYPVPIGFEGRTGIAWTGVVGTNNPYIKNVGVEATRTTAGWDGDVWQPNLATIDFSDCVSEPPFEAFELNVAFITFRSGRMTEFISSIGFTVRQIVTETIFRAIDELIRIKNQYGAGVTINFAFAISNQALGGFSFANASVDALANAKNIINRDVYSFFHFYSVSADAFLAVQNYFDTAGATSERNIFYFTYADDVATIVDGPQFGTPATRRQELIDVTAPMVNGVSPYDVIGGKVTNIWRYQVNSRNDGLSTNVQNQGIFPITTNWDDVATEVAGIVGTDAQQENPADQPIVGANGAHMVYETRTNRVWGQGWPTATIDETSFLAAAQALFDECFGLCISTACFQN